MDMTKPKSLLKTFSLYGLGLLGVLYIILKNRKYLRLGSGQCLLADSF